MQIFLKRQKCSIKLNFGARKNRVSEEKSRGHLGLLFYMVHPARYSKKMIQFKKGRLTVA